LHTILALNPRHREPKLKAAAEGIHMVADLNFLDEWIPEQMEPGTMFLLDGARKLGKADNPYWAVLACPSCGALGLITRQQCAGLEAMICGSDTCSAEYFLADGYICYRQPN
jgi:hypothetical protein